jgi:hypothetical protein
VTTDGRGDVEPVTVSLLAGNVGWESRPDLLASVGCQAVVSTGASVGEACGRDGVCTGGLPAPGGGAAPPVCGPASAVDGGVGRELPPLPAARVLVTGTTVRIWAETPLMMVWVVVWTVTTVEVVGVWPGFPLSTFEPPVLVGVPSPLFSPPGGDPLFLAGEV